MDKKIMEYLRHMPISKKLGGLTLLLSVVLTFTISTAVFAGEDSLENIPAKGVVTMIDLGAGYCVPCKMMAPILEKMEKKYSGKAVIHFYDVRDNRDQAEKYKIRAIPTQIFFNKEGKEVYRHLGFLSEADIVQQFNKMGVK